MRLLLIAPPGPLAAAFTARAGAAGHEVVHLTGEEDRGAYGQGRASVGSSSTDATVVEAGFAAVAEVLRRTAPDAVVELNQVCGATGHDALAALPALVRQGAGRGLRLLLCQDASVYGEARALPLEPRREQRAHPDSAPGRTARARERAVLRAAAEGALRPVLLRCAALGHAAVPPLAPLRRARFWPWAPAGRPLQLLHPEDAAGALLCALRAPSPGPYNVASDGVVAYGRARRAAGALPVPVTPALLPAVGSLADLARAWRWLTRAPVLDNNRLKGYLGFRPRHTTAATLQQALERC